MTNHSKENLEKIADLQIGMDVIIVSTNSELQAAYWQQRLEAGNGICKEGALVLVVFEDWPGGAGNGLGTLYAIKKAAEKAQGLYSIDVLKMQADGASVALYHTAGKGTRLAPLPGSECNNKPAVKLPSLIQIGGEEKELTILEAVIKQTAIYAPSRKGRLSVFWGDQIFIPSVSVDYDARFHADILCKKMTMPDAIGWDEKGLDKYGLIAISPTGESSQVEKISHQQASDLITENKIAVEGGIGASIGSFSISENLLRELLNEFAEELEKKSGKLDTDPHFWMPMTLDLETYRQIMKSKNSDETFVDVHYQRMQNLKARLDASLGCFSGIDIGETAYWWDYGLLPKYHEFNLKLLDDDAEAKAMRDFFGIENLTTMDIDDIRITNSSCLSSKIKNSTIKNSIVINSVLHDVSCENALIINSRIHGLTAGKNALLYNVCAENLELGDSSVRADVYQDADTTHQFYTTLSRHGGDDWHEKLANNAMSYDELHKLNLQLDPSETEKLSRKKSSL